MEFEIQERVRLLKKNAAARWDIDEKHCHIGHLLLQAMLQEPDGTNQVDGATGQSETNLSVAQRASQLANAMAKSGLNPGDTVVVMGINHLDLAIPFYACHFGGYSMCAIDPMGAADLKNLWKYIQPKMIFCQKSCEEKIKETFKVNSDSCEVILFDDETVNINGFVNQYEGTAINYRPALVDQSNTAAWLILTSGTTGLPKVSIIPFSVVLNAVVCWWLPTPEKVESVFAMATLQWMSGLLFFVAGPIKCFTRLQSSTPPTPQGLISLINTYKPNVTAFTPYLLGRFLEGAENTCDMSCFTHIIIGGSAIEKPLLDRIRKVCNAKVIVVYGMTELLIPVFEFDNNTPFGSSGKPFDKYEYKLVDNNGQILESSNETGELCIKGKDSFFKGYMNNPEETRHILTDDGWVKTGDIFYKDKENYYYFVERKRLMFKHYGFQFSPLQMEKVLKRHKDVADVCVIDIPKLECTELPIAAILRKNGNKVEFQDLFDLLNNNISPGRKFSTGFFFIDAFPVTPSGKVHRAKVKEMALNAKFCVFNRNV